MSGIGPNISNGTRLRTGGPEEVKDVQKSGYCEVRHSTRKNKEVRIKENFHKHIDKGVGVEEKGS